MFLKLRTQVTCTCRPFCSFSKTNKPKSPTQNLVTLTRIQFELFSSLQLLSVRMWHCHTTVKTFQQMIHYSSTNQVVSQWYTHYYCMRIRLDSHCRVSCDRYYRIAHDNYYTASLILVNNALNVYMQHHQTLSNGYCHILAVLTHRGHRTI